MHKKKICTYAKFLEKKKSFFRKFFFATGLIFERFLAPRSRFFEKVNGLGVLGKANTTMVLSGIYTSMAGWHNRLAHPHEAILRRLVSTFNLPTSSNNVPSICEPFQLGKNHKLPFTSDHISCTKPFELIYFNV
ncbi:hypothetical protein LXL04_024775 [Taraxacum kok-saghyz]